jgi:hypothetical protein
MGAAALLVRGIGPIPRRPTLFTYTGRRISYSRFQDSPDSRIARRRVFIMPR